MIPMKFSLNKFRLLAVLSVSLFLAALSVGGCSFSSAGDEISHSNPVDLSFSWWGNDARHKYTLAGLELFESRNKDMRVSCTFGVWNGFERRMNVFIKSHNEADVMQITSEWLSTFSPNGNGFYDISRLSGEVDLSCFSRQDLAVGTRGGKLNALPIAYNTCVFFYNMTLLEKYGIEKVPETWYDLFAAASLLSKDGIYMLGNGRKHMFLMLMAWFEQNYGHPMFDQNGYFIVSEDEMEALLSFYKKCLDTGMIIPVDDFASGVLEGGKVASVMCWISDSERLCQGCADAGNEIRLGLPPHTAGGDDTGWYVKPASLYAISANTEHPAEAARLLNFLINDREMAVLQGTEKGVPVSSSALDALKDSGNINEFTLAACEQMEERMDHLNIFLPEMENDNLITTFKEESDKYLYDETDLHTCAVNTVQRIKTHLVR